MSERLTIDVVCAEHVWSNSYGEYQAYMLDVKTEDGRIVGNVSSNRKLKDDGSHFEPKEGEEVWGSLESKGGGKWKLTLDSQRMKAEPLGGSRPASHPSESSTGTAQSPKGETDWEVRNAEIRRQHSQEMALRALTKNATATGTKDVIKGWADWFDQDAIAAGQKASTHPPLDFSGARTAEPDPVAAIAQTFDATPIPDDTHQWIENELIVGGASSTKARALATYAMEKLRPEQRATLESELRHPDSEAKAAGLRRLEGSYVKAEGHPVPTAEDFSDLPF